MWTKWRLDVLVKDKQLFVNDPPKESVIRSVVLKKYGIDPTLRRRMGWDIVAEMKLDAAAARDKINNRKVLSEMPKVMTKEQREQAQAEAQAQKKAIAPLKETFSKLTSSRKTILDLMFLMSIRVNYQICSSLCYWRRLGTQWRKSTIRFKLRDALLLYQYFPKIREI